MSQTSTLKFEREVVFTPNETYLINFMEKVAKELNLKAIGVSSTEELEILAAQRNSLAGVVFNEVLNTYNLNYGGRNIQAPSKITYTIRFPSELRAYPTNVAVFNWVTDFLYPLFPESGPRAPIEPSGGSPPGYYTEGFLALQHSISKAFIDPFQTSKSLLDDLQIQRFSYPPCSQDQLLGALSLILPFMFLLSYVYTCINTVKFITVEKEKVLKETMKIMGLDSWLHWTAWFVRSMTILTISNIIIVIMLKITWFPNSPASVFTYSSGTVLFAFFTIYSMTIVTYCFMISVFFSKANLASSVSGIMWFIFYMPYLMTENRFFKMKMISKICLCLFNNSAMSFHFKILVMLEGTTEGLQWSNLFTPILRNDNFSIGYLWLILIFDSFLYLIIALYFEKIMPGDIGVPEKWNFFLKKKFWIRQHVTEYADNEFKDVQFQNIKFMEAEPENKYAGIQIKNLRKVFGNKVVLNGLTINMYEDQITVLLGHNGAGKTTLMSMLAGIFEPSSGTALINGKNLRTDMDGVRKSLGICPQYNVLFDELTVREHIIFFSKLKNVHSTLIEKEVIKYVNLLDIKDKTNAKSSTLSGGMKRKLSMAIALCGDSKVVLCDEPTSGMDPYARRALWDVFQQEKKGRTILLSTHFMDEADILGDRIAIMSAGNLKCCGSSFYLKKEFGIGYHLICVKTKKCQTSKMTNLLAKYFPSTIVESDIGSELSYAISEKFIDKLPQMLNELERKQNCLGISSYGLSLTTLEEVFMSVGCDVSDDEFGIDLENQKTLEDTSSSSAHNEEFEESGYQLLVNRIESMFLKKIFYSLKTWIVLLIQNLIPVVFILVLVIAMHGYVGEIDLPPLTISLDSYKKTVTTIQLDKSVTNNSDRYNVIGAYVKMIKEMPSHIDYDLITEDILKYVYKIQKSSILKANTEYLIGVQMESNKFICFFNNQPYHTTPLTLNMAHNAVFKSFSKAHSITVINHPLPYNEKSRLEILNSGRNFGLSLATVLGFAMAFNSAFYVLFYIKERECRAKLLQIICGIDMITFWTTAYIWDLLIFLITCFSISLTLLACQEDGYKTIPEITRCFILLLAFGWGMLPLHYLASMLYTVPSSGFTRMSMFNIFTGVSLFLVSFILGLEFFDSKNISNFISNIGMFFPHFALTHGLYNLYIMGRFITMCNDGCKLIGPGCTPDILCDNFNKTFCCDLDFYKWSEPGIQKNIVYLLSIGIILFITLLIKEVSFIKVIMYFMRKLYASKRSSSKSRGPIDSDVKSEIEKVSKMNHSEITKHNLVIKNVRKFYNKFLAVNDISVAVDKSECFGLLGTNGAGKTTMFKMLIGDEELSSGNVWVKGINLNIELSKVYKKIGYCPQFDALIEDLTGRETLKIFCLLRGIPKKNIKDTSIRLAMELNFFKHIDKKVKECSGGNKRKLSTALALIGNPSIIYLDEPTTGMDPASKRHLWNMIIKVRNMGQTILLTSHYMEECEALCTRLAIMVNGEFKCVGSSQHLKNKFSQGLVLTIKAIKPKKSKNINKCQKVIVSGIKNFLDREFPEAILKEEFQGVLVYFIKENVRWSSMFYIMQTAKSSLGIEDYAIVQTSLEQVFLSFAKKQRIVRPIRQSIILKFAKK